MSCRVLKHSLMALAVALLLLAPALAEEVRQGQLEPATIRVELPEDARLTFDGESTVSTGSRRLFVSPPLLRGMEFTYTLRAERMEGGKPNSLSKTITVRAGEETQVDLLSGYATVAEVVRGIEEAAEDRADKPGATTAGKKGPRFNLDGFLKDYDKNKDGHLTRDELPPELRPAFDRLDTNKDDKVSREELERGTVHLHPARRPSDLIHVLIDMSACDDVCHGELQRSYDILRKLDKNQDGKIDPDELKAARLRIVEDRVDYLFAELDKNKDGKIGRKEAKGMLLEDFGQIDRDKDGFIDRAELTRAATDHLEASATVGSGPRPKTEAPKDN